MALDILTGFEKGQAQKKSGIIMRQSNTYVLMSPEYQIEVREFEFYSGPHDGDKSKMFTFAVPIAGSNGQIVGNMGVIHRAANINDVEANLVNIIREKEKEMRKAHSSSIIVPSYDTKRI